MTNPISTRLRRQAEPLGSIRVKDVLDLTAHEAADCIEAQDVKIKSIVNSLRVILDSSNNWNVLHYKRAIAVVLSEFAEGET